jgi:transposase
MKALLRLQAEIRRSAESRYHHRLHAVLLVAQGMTCPQAAQWLGDSRRAVEYWVRRFDDKGLAGLREAGRSGRPARMTGPQIELVRTVLRRPPPGAVPKGKRWNGKLLSAYLKRQLGLALGVRQCQRLLQQLGSPSGKPKRRNSDASPARQIALVRRK